MDKYYNKMLKEKENTAPAGQYPSGKLTASHCSLFTNPSAVELQLRSS